MRIPMLLPSRRIPFFPQDPETTEDTSATFVRLRICTIIQIRLDHVKTWKAIVLDSTSLSSNCYLFIGQLIPPDYLVISESFNFPLAVAGLQRPPPKDSDGLQSRERGGLTITTCRLEENQSSKTSVVEKTAETSTPSMEITQTTSSLLPANNEGHLTPTTLDMRPGRNTVGHRLTLNND